MHRGAPWIAALCLGGCVLDGDPCQKQMAECLERCDRGGDSLDERTQAAPTHTS